VSNFYSLILGEEVRFLYSPRMSLLGETRYGITTYPDDPTRDSTNLFLLAGGELTLTRQIAATARVGVQARTFAEAGETRLGPYGETTLSWRYHPAGILTWTTRFGFEEPPSANTTVEVFRTSIALAQGLSARLRVTGGISAAYSASTVDDNEELNSSDNSFSLNAGMEYAWSRNLTLTGSYNFIGNLSTLQNSNYFRNQIFLGLQYTF
jgi:hypothetical protein